ncbi:MAG: amylo-alpha-1,6-glucosidase [Chloroflexi bacterium]|nr:amylo-alpha-1,6-glucosidase [Chloroflexota bacterium]
MTVPGATDADRTDWLPSGEEPQALGSIAHYVVLRSNGISALSLPSGDMDAGAEPSTGLYYRDTRHLSRLWLSFGGVAPILVDAREMEHGLTAIFTNPELRAPSGRIVPAQSLILRRRRVLSEGLVESLTISNYGRDAVDLQIRCEFDADFHDIFVVRGFERLSPTPPVHTSHECHTAAFQYTGVDGIGRTTTLAFHPQPDSLAPREALYFLHLEPRETLAIHIEVFAEHQQAERSNGAGAPHPRPSAGSWLDCCTRIETDDDAVTGAIERALLDIEALHTVTGDIEYVAAGVPWYDTLFGRDSLITGIELLAFCPEVLRTSLFTLARHQAQTVDAIHDASPGKIAHELRWGELANADEVPFGCYYGSVDSTPLFILAAAEYFRWTGDLEAVRALWPAIEAAVEWCGKEAAHGVDGFLSYARVSEKGLENQGWKDSHDAIVHADGRHAAAPIALIEVQGYLAAALGAYANLARALGHESAFTAGREAAAFADRIDERFGDPELGYVLGLDGNGDQIQTAASNAGHMLWCGIARKDLAQLVANRLLKPDMFSGWGVRTLSSDVVGYNPLGYHVGSVWPHDNAMILHGLRWFGFDAQADQLASAMLHMALGFPGYRVPELFCGDARELRIVPTPYPVASRPQAWSAASIPYLMTSMLGIRPQGTNQLAIVRPMLPANLQWVRVKGLRIGGGAVDIAFRRAGKSVSVEVEDIRHGVEVVLSGSWPEEGRGAHA